jgi:hypothetical protein
MAEDILNLEERPSRRWLSALGWPLVVLVGLLLFEVTAQPAAAVIALCLEFSENDPPGTAVPGPPWDVA